MIGNIEEGISLHLNNLLYYTGELSENEIKELFLKLEQFLSQNHIKKTGNTITCTKSTRLDDRGQQRMQFELFVPVDCEHIASDIFSLISDFTIENALKIFVDGSASQFELAVKELSGFIISKKLKPTTPILIETINEGLFGKEITITANLYVSVMFP